MAGWFSQVFVLLSVLAAGPALVARAQETNPPAAVAARDEAKAEFERGVQCMDRGDPVAAIAAFEHAQALQPHPAVLYNLGLAYRDARRSADAVHAFREYLVLPIEEGREERRALVANEIERLLEQLGTLRVVTGPGTTTVVIDGQVAAAADYEAGVLVTVGPHHVECTFADGRMFAHTVDVIEKTITVLDTRVLAPVASELAPTPPLPPPPMAAGSRAIGVGELAAPAARADVSAAPRMGPYVMGGAGLLLLVSGACTQLWNDGRRDGLSRDPNVSTGDLAGSVQRWDMLSAASLVLGAALTGTAFTWFFLQPSRVAAAKSLAANP